MTKRLLTTIGLVAALAAIAATVTWAVTGRNDQGTGPWSGMMGNGYGMMGDGYGASMMGATVAGNGTQTVQTLADAKRQAQRFADRLDLRVGEVMEFSNGFYASLLDGDGNGATEVLVYRNGAVHLEFGPAMMWNTEYSPMAGYGMMGSGSGGMMGNGSDGGMMGNGSYGGMMDDGSYGGMMGGAVDGSLGTASQTVSAADAVTIANRWLDANRPGLSVQSADAFPGYYTLHTLRDGKIAGMLSVNASTGAVWYHTWHGSFVAMTE